MNVNNKITALFRREILIILRHPIYIICMVVLPILATYFFTSLLSDGQPVRMPIGIVDNDNTTVTRKMIRLIDAFQSSEVVAHYPSVAEARKAIQQNKIYGFIYFPENMTQELLSARQPKMSVYFSNTSVMVGSLLFKEMKTLCTLGSASVALATMQAKGFTEKQAMAILQPIQLDTHAIGNPWVNYNIYLSTMVVPACLLLFVFLLTAYSLGTEIKFGTHKEWLEAAGNNMALALFTKLLPQTLIFTVMLTACMTYMAGPLHFPAPGGFTHIILYSILSVLAAQGFAVFIFGLIPSLRMAMSVCSLWGVLSYSMAGTTFPIFAMDPPLQALAVLFPLRHSFIIYRTCIFNDFPLTYVTPHIIALLIFTILPAFIIQRMKKAFNQYGYQP